MSARSLSRGSRGWVRPARYAASATIALLVGSTMVGGCGTGAPTPTATSEAGMGPASSAPAYVRIDRGAHPLARPEVDVGPLDPGMRIDHLSILFKLSPKQVRERDALLADLIDAGSPRYHQWLTTTEYAARFGARPDDIARVTSWLAQQGFDVHDVSPLGARVTFSGTVASLQTAFHTEMHRFQVGGQTHYAMASAPSIPSELSDVVLGVLGTHDFHKQHVKPDFVRTTPAATCPGGDTYCAGNGIAPPDWAAIYDVNLLYNPGIGGTKINGTGVRIGIVGLTQIAQSDINAFRTRYGLPASTVTMDLVPNTGAAQQ
jgi:subtilase family serine protease